MNEQDREPVLDPNAPASLPESQPSGAPASTPPPRTATRAGSAVRRPFGWIGGAILVLLGVVFLLEELGIPFLENWWALFILIPACRAFVVARRSYQDNGRLTRGGAGALVGGALLTILALAFLFNLDFDLFWPLLLIAGGLALLGTTLWPK